MKLANKAISILLGLCLILALAVNSFAAPGDDAGTAAEAAEETVETTDSVAALRAEALESIMNSDPGAASRPITARPNVYAPYHKDFEYSSDIVLSGVFQTNTYYFQIEDYWDYMYAYAEIQIDVSQLVTDVPASLTFMVNSTPVVSYLIDYENGRSQTFYVQFPTRLLKKGFNTFDITGYARIFDDDGCLDDFTGANWVSIRKESYIQVGYDLKQHEYKISYFPYPFISSVDPSGSGCYVAVSDNQSNEELEAALSLRAALAAKTDHNDRIGLASLSGVPDTAYAMILISEYDNLPKKYKDGIKNYESRLKDKAIVQFTQDGLVTMMLITSKDKDCLMEGVSMLMDENRVSQERGSIALVDKGGIELMQEMLSENLAVSGRYTLDALVHGGLSFIGPYHQEAFIYLPFTGGYVLSEASKVVLNYRYSDNLDFDRSMVTVFWGDVPVASKKLTREHSGGDELAFTMPHDVVGTHADSIRIAFELELPELFCTPRMDDMPWAYVSDESVFYLPVGENTSYKFGLRPYPFERNSVFNDFVVVVPDKMGLSEMQALGRIMAAYGENLEPYGDINVVRPGELKGELKKHHLIVFGTYKDNSVIKDLNKYLGFTFNKDGTAYESNSTLILSDDYAREIATLQIFPSPYENERAVLVCSTATKAGFDIFAEFFEDDEKIWGLTGDTVLIDKELEIKAFELQESGVVKSAPLLKRMLEENRDSTIFAIVAISAMLLLLLSVILIFIRVYWNQMSKK